MQKTRPEFHSMKAVLGVKGDLRRKGFTKRVNLKPGVKSILISSKDYVFVFFTADFSSL